MPWLSVWVCTVSAAHHCVTGIFAIQVQKSQMLVQPAVLQAPSPPVQCVECLTVGSWDLQLPEWFFFVVLTPHLLLQREGAGLPPSWRHLDNAVVGHRQGDLTGQGTSARNFKWRLPKNILHSPDYPSFTGWHRQRRKLLRWPEFHIKELTYSACLQTEWMIFQSNWTFCQDFSGKISILFLDLL